MESEYHGCAYCNSPSELICGRCEEAYYCKPEHQRLDWKKHSLACRSLTEMKAEHRQKLFHAKANVFDLISREKKPMAIDAVKTSIV